MSLVLTYTNLTVAFINIDNIKHSFIMNLNNNFRQFLYTLENHVKL